MTEVDTVGAMLEDLVDALEQRRGHGPNDLHELVYQLALQLKVARTEIRALQKAVRP
jgi:hypothetical protein